MLDSCALTELAEYGRSRHAPEEYAEQIVRWASKGTLPAAETQDFMREQLRLEKTVLTVEEHQRLTIERNDRIRAAVPGHIHILPVLQGFTPDGYASHIRQYGPRLTPGMWAGIGSVRKRTGSPRAIEDVVRALENERPDLRLHGFGLTPTALRNAYVREDLESSDSMAWSYAARMEGRSATIGTTLRLIAGGERRS